MPLQDHFRPPLRDLCTWDSFHSGWAHEMVRLLNKQRLPRGFVARPHVKLGVEVEADVAALERGNRSTSAAPNNGGVTTAVWAPPQPTLATAVDFARLDLFEVRIHRGGALELVAAVELVSPRNKDRPDARRAFAVKCASYLQQGVSVVIVDAVTERTANLHAELFELLGRSPEGTEAAPLYAASYRTRTPEEPTRLEAWVESLSLGSPLPTLPLWLDTDLAVPFDLEESYLSTFDALQIGP